MSFSRRHFVIPDPFKHAQLQDMLQSRFSLRAEPAKTAKRTVYDTFDWLLYQKDAGIETQQAGRTESVVWHAPKAQEGCRVAGQRSVPRFAHDLPPCEFRSALASIISVRALQPQIIIHSKASVFSIVDEEDKAVVRVLLEDMTCRLPDARAVRKLCRRLTLQKVKGYDDDFDRVAAYIEEQSLLPANNNLLKLALLTLGVVPGEYSSSFKVRLDPEMSAADAAKKIMLNLLDVIELNREGAIEGSDTEFLHDLRVAVRKTRSALSRIRKVFPKRRIRRFADDFSWLGQATTTVRDLDVYLLGFDAYRDSVPPEHHAGLEPLYDYLARRRAAEQEKLVSALRSKRFGSLVEDWRAFLTSPTGSGAAPNAGRGISGLADEYIWQLYCKVLDEGRAITPKSPDEDLHELRKTCKKLRYLMEFFQSLYPARQIRDAIKKLKRFQTLLGDFQDLSVQIQTLRQFRKDMKAAGELPDETIDATRALIKSLKKRKKQQRAHFEEEFEAFSTSANQAEFRKLFFDSRPGGRQQSTSQHMEPVA